MIVKTRSVRQFGQPISCCDGLRGTVVVAEKATDALSNAAAVMLAFNIGDQFVVEALMVPFAMVVDEELRESTTEVALTQGNDAVQAFFFDRANKPLRVGIAVRRTKRCPGHAHTRRLEQMSNGGAPLPISVADQEALPVEHAVGRIGEMTRDLEHDAFIRMRRAANDVNSPRV
jgi:hypothetical protein